MIMGNVSTIWYIILNTYLFVQQGCTEGVNKDSNPSHQRNTEIIFK